MFRSQLFPEECPAGCDGTSACPACNPSPAIDPKTMPEMSAHEYRALTHGRRQAAKEAYQHRIGCSTEEAEAVVAHWHQLATELGDITTPVQAFGARQVPLGSMGHALVFGFESPSVDPEDQILRDEEEAGLTEEELAAGQAGFDAHFPIVTRPGESLIDTVEAARQADAEQFSNDLKPR